MTYQNRPHKFLLQSLHADGIHVIAFIRQRTAEGYPLTKLLRKMVKHGVNTTSTTIYAIDPDDFPTVSRRSFSTLDSVEYLFTFDQIITV